MRDTSFFNGREYVLPSLDLAVGSQHINDFTCDHILHGLSGRLQILTRIEMIRMLGKVLADVSCHGKPDIRVDIDLADSGLGGFAELFFGDADGIRHIAAVGIDHLYEFLRHR